MRYAVVLLAVFSLGCDDEPDEPDCTQLACVRPYICAATCDGPTTNHGCCSCPEGQLDVLEECPSCPDECTVACEGETCGCDCPAAEPEAEPVALPATAVTDRPCSIDEECHPVQDCDCECAPRLRTAPRPEGLNPCNGHPPPSCGATSPCAGFTALCQDGVCVVAVEAAE